MSQTRGISQGTDQQFLLSANFSYAPILDQSVGHIAKRRLDSLLILRERVLALSLFKVDARLKSTGGKNRLGDLGNENPSTAWTPKKNFGRNALEAKSTRNADRSERNFFFI